MPLIDALLPEFDREMGLTRRALEQVPDGTFDWQPHPTSLTLGRLAEHLCDMPYWATLTLAQAGADMPPEQPAGYTAPTSRAAVLAQFDRALKEARGHLLGKTDGEFAAPWKLTTGGKEVFTMPKGTVMRTFVLNHMIHHRGQLVMYLRMLDVPIPSFYGPSADEAF